MSGRDCAEDVRTNMDQSGGERNHIDCTKVTMQKRDCADVGGIKFLLRTERDGAEQQETPKEHKEWC